MKHPLSSPGPLSLEEAELLHHIQLARFLYAKMGGHVPVDLGQAHTVLDIACGTCGWAFDLAYTFPHIQVTSIDGYIASAQSLVWANASSNVTFLRHDLRCLDELGNHLLPESFDLVHVAFIAPLLLTLDYPALLQTLLGLVRPGGILCWTEMEFPGTSSLAFERLIRLTCRALQEAGQSFLPASYWELAKIFEALQREAGLRVLPYERRHLGITPMLGSWLNKAGCQDIQRKVTAIDVSAWTEAHPLFVRQVQDFLRQVRSLLLQQAVLSEEACEQLFSQVQQELCQDVFCGLCLLLTVWVHRPS